MKKERQIGIRVGLPAFFALELEDVYRHTQGAHRALAFPDFVGLLVGLGLEQYRKGNAPEPAPEIEQGEAQGDEGREDPFFDTDPRDKLHNLFREYDQIMDHEESPEQGPRIRLVPAGELAEEGTA